MNNKTQQQIPLTYEAIMASLEKTDRILSEKFAETDRIFKETFAEIRQIQKENELKRAAEEKERNEARAAEEKARIEAEKARIAAEKRMKKLEKLMGSWSNNHGSFVEEYFFNSFEDEQQDFFGEHFNDIDKNLKPPKKNNLRDEYDIVMYNDSYIAIVEAKFKAHQNDIPEVIRKAETFRILCPDYKDYKIYLGLASLSFYPELEQECIEHGIAVIKQVGDTVVINDAHLKVF